MTDMSPEGERVRRSRRKDARPAEILDAAMHEFAANGFGGARLSDVAKRAGLSHGSIYNYFDSKESLFRALVQSRLLDNVDAALFAGALSGKSPPDILRIALKGAFKRLVGSDAVALLSIMLVEGNKFPDLAAECHNEVLRKAGFLLQILIQHGIDQGYFRPGDYQKHMNIFVSVVSMPAIFGPLTGRSDWIEETDQSIDAFLDMITNGIGIRAP